MRSSILSLATASVLSTSALAFIGTSPLVAWSSDSNLSGIQALAETVQTNGPIVPASSAFNELLSGEELCGLNVLVISQEALHSSDLRSTPLISTFLSESSLNIPYLTSASSDSLESSLQALAVSCGTKVDTLEAGEALSDLKSVEEGGMRVVKVLAGREEVEGESQDAMLRWEDALIAPQIKSFLDTYPSSHLIVLTGHPLTSFERLQAQRRQEAYLEAATSSIAAAPSSADSNSTANLPLLARYEITSVSILTMLFVSFGILIPILSFGIMALTSVSVPPRMDNVKGIQTITADKKNN